MRLIRRRLLLGLQSPQSGRKVCVTQLKHLKIGFEMIDLFSLITPRRNINGPRARSEGAIRVGRGIEIGIRHNVGVVGDGSQSQSGRSTALLTCGALDMIGPRADPT